MGRMRIKKKDAVIPFRETMAYRTILILGCLIALLVGTYVLIVNLATNTPLAIAGGVVAAAAAFLTFYNVDQTRHARVPKRTLDRMKRR
jgi:hypothetical protein